MSVRLGSSPAARQQALRPAPESTAPRWIAAALCVVLFAVYVSNLRVLSAADSIPTRLLPFSILREGNLNLDEFGWLWEEHLPYYVRFGDGHLYSGTTVALPLLVTPLYAIPAALLGVLDIPYDDVRARLLIVAMERVSAASLTALTASLLYVVLCRLTTWRWALVLALTYGLGTNAWVTASQALWPHTVSALAITVLSWLFVASAGGRAALLVAGITTAVLLANRPQLLGVALLATVFVWRYHRQHVVAFAALPLGAAGLVALYNLQIFRALAGHYVHFDQFSTPLLDGLAGLLCSPNRGLLVFTPVLLFAFWGALRVWRLPVHPWVRYLVPGLAWHLVVHAKFNEWWAGYTYGPRYLTDVLPILIVLSVYGIVPWCRSVPARVFVATLIVYGVAVQAVGVYWDDDGWNRTPVPLQARPARVWDWSDWQVARAYSGPFRGGELAGVIADVWRDPVPAQAAPLEQADLAGPVILRGVPARLPRDGEVTARAEITNRGALAWPAFTGDINVRYTVFLLVRWLERGQPIEGLGDVLRLPEHVAPGERVTLPVPLRAPSTSGAYEVEVFITQAVDGTQGVRSSDAARAAVVVE